MAVAGVDAYVASLPSDSRVVVEEIRSRIRAAVPAVTESISYGIPTFSLDGRVLLYVAAWKHFISVYPLPADAGELEDELAPYRAAKSTARFPLTKPIPYDLIERWAAQAVTS
jgi:uncharacterized protein YdhG (YjbR/CyaY superfamily)